jgi:hypothetical protein
MGENYVASWYQLVTQTLVEGDLEKLTGCDLRHIKLLVKVTVFSLL